MIPKPYLWIAAGVAMLLLLGFTGWKAYGLGEDHQKAEAQKKVDEANAKVTASDTRYDTLAGQQTGLLQLVSSLASRPPPNPQTLIREVPTNGPVTTCPDRSPEFRVYYNAIAASDTVARAAEAVPGSPDRPSGVQPP